MLSVEQVRQVRYYGLFSPGRRELLGRVRQLVSCALAPPRQDPQFAAELLPPTEFLCPACGKPMQLVSILRPRGRGPPEAQSA